MRRFSIAEDVNFAVATAVVDHNRWTKRFGSVDEAIHECTVLGMTAAQEAHLATHLHRSHPWIMDAELPQAFKDTVLNDNGWTRMNNPHGTVKLHGPVGTE